MAFTTEFLPDGGVRTWALTADGATAAVDESYTPTFYVGTDDRHVLGDVELLLVDHPLVEGVAREEHRPGWRHDYEEMVRVEASSLAGVDEVAGQVARHGRPGGYRCYNVDFAREFRYHLETGESPAPRREPRVVSLSAPRGQVAGVDALTDIEVDDQAVSGDPGAVATTVADLVRDRDPDVLRVSSADLLPRLFKVADRDRESYALGRLPGLTKRAGESTYESYGRVGHSPARYSVPGRAVLDESNSFFLDEAGLDGILDLVERSGKPLQEAAWASIGNILTAIQFEQDACQPLDEEEIAALGDNETDGIVGVHMVGSRARCR